MKKNFIILLLIAMALIIHSCSPKAMPRTVITSFADYSKYSNEGFLVSPNPYPDKFISVGEIFIIVVPGDKVKQESKYFDSQTNTYNVITKVYKENISLNELTDLAVQQTKAKGANALVNFKIQIINNQTYSNLYKRYIPVFSHYEISGFAIKI